MDLNAFQSQMLHPTYLYGIQLLIIVFALGFTHHSSPPRLVLGAVVAVFPLLSVPKAIESYDSTARAMFFAFGTIPSMLQYLEVGILSSWDFDSYGPAKHGPRTGTPIIQVRIPTEFLQRVVFGFYSAFSFRCSGTNHEINHIPPFNPKDVKDVPSRKSFCLAALQKGLLYYLWLDIVAAAGDPAANPINYAQSKIPFFSRLSEVGTEEVALRIVTTVVFHSASYCFIELMWIVPAVICVGGGLTSVSWWRPQNWNIKECYSVRQFWGFFWHQMFRQRFGHPASWFSNNILGLRKGSLVARYVTLFGTFLVSAIYHYPLDYVSRVPLSDSGAIKFFLLQAVGITLEDFVQWGWTAMYGEPSPKTRRNCQWAGYMWTLLWLSWSEPCWTYPLLALQRGEKRDELLPFSPVKMLFNK